MKTLLNNTFYKYFKHAKIDNASKYIEILKTKNPKFGDYTSNTPLKLTTILKKNPIDIANDIKSFLEKNYKDMFVDITVTKPGFINLFISEKLLVEESLKFLDNKHKPDYHPKTSNFKPTKLNYEFISANPTGFLHIGHLRNAIVGDITAELFKEIGDKVIREYWLNDYGNQIDTLGNSVFYYYAKKLNHKISLTEEDAGYQGYEIKEYGEKLAKKDKTLIKLSDKEAIEELKIIATAHFLKEIKNIIKELKLRPFDHITSEKELYDTGKVKKVLNELQERGALYMEDGATWIKTSKFGDDKDRVIVKSDGSMTYMTADVAGHKIKLERGEEYLIDLWGADHHGYENRIQSGLKLLGYESNPLEVNFISMVQIKDDGNVIKMSKRKGTSLTIREMLNIMNVDLLKYFIISKSKEQNLILDLARIKEHSNNNPYYYVQYTNSRMYQLLQKLKIEYPKINIEKVNSKSFLKNFEMDERERNLLLKISEYPNIIASSVSEREPYHLIIYIEELAKAFNSFYNKCRVISEDELLSEKRGALVQVVANIFKRIFDLLAIEPITKM